MSNEIRVEISEVENGYLLEKYDGREPWAQKKVKYFRDLPKACKAAIRYIESRKTWDIDKEFR